MIKRLRLQYVLGGFLDKPNICIAVIPLGKVRINYEAGALECTAQISPSIIVHNAKIGPGNLCLEHANETFRRQPLASSNGKFIIRIAWVAAVNCIRLQSIKRPRASIFRAHDADEIILRNSILFSC
jgi:hypothetical protein